MCGFIAQLVEQGAGNAEVTGSNPVEGLISFFQASSFQLLKLENSTSSPGRFWGRGCGKFTAMIILHSHILYCYSVTLLPCYSVMLLPCYSVMLLPCYSVTLLLCYLITLLPYYSVTLLLCFLVSLG